MPLLSPPFPYNSGGCSESAATPCTLLPPFGPNFQQFFRSRPGDSSSPRRSTADLLATFRCSLLSVGSEPQAQAAVLHDGRPIPLQALPAAEPASVDAVQSTAAPCSKRIDKPRV